MREPTPPTRQQKITLGEMRSSGVRGLLVYCADYHCSHSIAISTEKPLDSMLTIDTAIHDAVMALPPDERRDRAKVNAAVREGAGVT